MEFHPLAEIFPLMSDAEFEALKNDIAENGLIEPIRTFNGSIIDGRNRFLVCRELGIAPRYSEWDGTAQRLSSYLVSLNLHRRNLNESQRAMVAAKLARLRRETALGAIPSIEGKVTQQQASQLLNVSQASVERAVFVEKEGVFALSEKVEKGEIKVSVAAEIAKLPKGKQLALIKRGNKHLLQYATAKRIRSVHAKSVKTAGCVICSDKVQPSDRLFIDALETIAEKFGGLYARYIFNILDEFTEELALDNVQDATERVLAAIDLGFNEFSALHDATGLNRAVLEQILNVSIANKQIVEETQGGKTESARGKRKRMFSRPTND